MSKARFVFAFLTLLFCATACSHGGGSGGGFASHSAILLETPKSASSK